MSEEVANAELVAAWKAGNDAAATALFRRYEARLLALVRSRLSRRLSRRIDPEDVLLSAYRSFFVRARDGRIACGEGDDLWSILVVVALRKLARQARRHGSAGRSLHREAEVDPSEIDALVATEPTPDQAAMLADEVERLLERLDETARETVVRTLQGDDPTSIATELGIDVRSVRRAVDRAVTHLGMGREPLVSHRPGGTQTTGLPAPSVAATRTAVTEPLLDIPPRSDREFRLVRLVGTGAFSKVYEAIEIASGRHVAVKWLRKRYWREKRASDSLRNEATVLRALRNPGIVMVEGWGRSEGGAFFLVSELIDGKPLDRWWRSIDLTRDLAMAIGVLEKAVVAVHAAHVAGVVHGDVKPANILVTRRGAPVLCDFGFGARWDATTGSCHEASTDGGTAGFLAPEQISDAFGPLTPLTDVYGLGATIYALLTGEPPFWGQDVGETLARTLSSDRAVPPSSRARDVPTGLDDIVLRALGKEPAERFGSAEVMATALAALRDQIL